MSESTAILVDELARARAGRRAAVDGLRTARTMIGEFVFDGEASEAKRTFDMGEILGRLDRAICEAIRASGEKP